MRYPHESEAHMTWTDATLSGGASGVEKHEPLAGFSQGSEARRAMHAGLPLEDSPQPPTW